MSDRQMTLGERLFRLLVENNDHADQSWLSWILSL